MRRQFAPGLAVLDANRFEDLDETARHALLANTRLVNGIDERLGAAVHDRHFAAVDFDADIVNGQRANRGKKMLDRRHTGAISVAQDGAQGDVGNRVAGRRKLDLAVGAIWHDKTDACVRVCW